MTIRQDLENVVQKAKADLADAEAKKAEFEAQAGTWIDKEESEIKAFFSRVASHFGWNTSSETSNKTE